MTDIDGVFADLESVLDASIKAEAKEDKSSTQTNEEKTTPRPRLNSLAKPAPTKPPISQSSKSFIGIPASVSDTKQNEHTRPPPSRSSSAFINNKPFTLRERTTKPQTEEAQQPFTDVSIVSNIVKKENLMEGYLFKLSKNKAAAKLGKKSWKKRYFVLSAGILTMYDTKGGKKLKEVSLLSVLFKEYNDSPFSFEINTAEYVVVVRADDELSMHMWMNEILRQKQMRREQRVKDRAFVSNGTEIDFEEYKKIQKEKYELQMQDLEEGQRKKKWETQAKKVETITTSKEQIASQLQQAKSNKSSTGVKELETKLATISAELEREKKLEKEFHHDYSSIKSQNEFARKKKALEEEMADLTKKKAQAEDFAAASKYKKDLMRKEEEYKRLMQNS